MQKCVWRPRYIERTKLQKCLCYKVDTSKEQSYKVDTLKEQSFNLDTSKEQSCKNAFAIKLHKNRIHNILYEWRVENLCTN